MTVQTIKPLSSDVVNADIRSSRVRDTDIRRVSSSQKKIYNYLRNEPLGDREVLLEALLWRGFLAFRDADEIWLGRGSHEADVTVLQLIDGLEVEHIGNDRTRIASVRCNRWDKFEIAKAIIFLPHHQGFSGVGVDPWVAANWTQYASMQWGAKKAVCPIDQLDVEYAYDALDTGIALLVKTMPLIRVATALSCDGHARRNATINLHYPWDVVWGELVLRAVGTDTPNSDWRWTSSESCYQLTILPRTADDWIGMFIDIQNVARRLLDPNLIYAIGNARAAVIKKLIGMRTVSPEQLTYVAKKILAELKLATT